MTYVIGEPCFGTKDRSCVDVCPVDCIHPTAEEEAEGQVSEMLYINPMECIDCDACLTACPVNAILPADELPPEWAPYLAANRDWFVPDVPA